MLCISLEEQGHGSDVILFEKKKKKKKWSRCVGVLIPQKIKREKSELQGGQL